MKFLSLTTLLSLASLTLSFSIFPRQTNTLQTLTDTYAFTLTLPQFLTKRTSQEGPADLDWTSNGCSYSPDNPFGFNFKPSCQRHDFGYRNFKKQNRFTAANKARIDTKFKADMYNQCASEKFKKACETTATLYYEAVKAFGKKRASEILEARRAAEGLVG